ncbi:peroxin [Dispira parvispora]|uniref:Peroxin n=1 Tax=Dispira parvispora TaxID=1520584 RepID=A0A9W8AQK0_9FUNG|nr:peroxin [Dispira parvispora]
MWSSVSGFIKRHRNKALITAGIVGGVYWVGQYAKNKLVEMQAKMARDRLFQDNLRRRFEQNLQDCTFTVMSLLPTLCDPLLDSMNVERLVQTLKEYRKSPIEGTSVTAHSETESSHPEMTSVSTDEVHPTKSRVELWEEIKLQSFTRTLTALYCLDFLTVFVYLQLNLIGRYIYVDSVASLVHPKDPQDMTGSLPSTSLPTGKARRLPFRVEQGYLTLTWWFLHRGWDQCRDLIDQAVQDVVSQVSLKAKLTHLELVGLVSQIRQQVEKEQGERVALRKRFISNLLPTSPEDLRQTLVSGGADPSLLDDPAFQEILSETRDFLESEDFELVCARCLDRSFVVFFDTLHQFFPELPVPTPATSSVVKAEGGESTLTTDLVSEFEQFNAVEPRLPLATLIPRVTREVHQILNGFPNQYLDAITSVPELQALSAIIYTTSESYAP